MATAITAGPVVLGNSYFMRNLNETLSARFQK
jgi:hypothetical protein